MKVVAVSQRVDFFSVRKERRDAIDQRLIAFLCAAGFISVPVPNGMIKNIPNGKSDHQLLDEWLQYVKPQAFVLSGGNDIGQCPDRDLTEGGLLDRASKSQIPLLGICRGMQMMAHWAGGDLLPVQNHINTQHRLIGQLEGDLVNSFHNFSLGSCPNCFEILARSEDQQIEAIRHRTLPWEGWMWHPEREENFAVRDLLRIKDLFSA